MCIWYSTLVYIILFKSSLPYNWWQMNRKPVKNICKHSLILTLLDNIKTSEMYLYILGQELWREILDLDRLTCSSLFWKVDSELKTQTTIEVTFNIIQLSASSRLVDIIGYWFVIVCWICRSEFCLEILIYI